MEPYLQSDPQSQFPPHLHDIVALSEACKETTRSVYSSEFAVRSVCELAAMGSADIYSHIRVGVSWTRGSIWRCLRRLTCPP